MDECGNTSVASSAALAEELAEIRDAFDRRYADLTRVFDYYCACSPVTTKAAFSVSADNYMALKDCADIDPTAHCTVEECDNIFTVCNFESGKKNAVSPATTTEDKALMRFVFLECLTRIAVARFR